MLSGKTGTIDIVSFNRNPSINHLLNILQIIHVNLTAIMELANPPNSLLLAVMAVFQIE